MKHTPEPWIITEHSWQESSIWNKETGRTVCALSIEDDEDTQEVNSLIMDANAKRIIHCVNACAGIDNPGKVIKDAANLIERLIPYIPSNAVDMKLALNGPIEDARLTNIAAKVLKTLRPEQD